MAARTASTEGEFLQKLNKHLADVEADATEGILRGLPQDTYHFARGRVEIVRSLRETVIPAIIADLRKD